MGLVKGAGFIMVIQIISLGFTGSVTAAPTAQAEN
jgi:hypothetical protein